MNGPNALYYPILTLLLASLVIMGSPGPSTISATAMGAAYGFRRSLGYVSGLIAGTVAVLLAVAAGVVAILLSVPHGAFLLTAVSAVYILYLAFKIATAPPLSRRDDRAAAPAFSGGFLLAVANPKAYLAIAAVFAGVSLFHDQRLLDAAVKIVLLTGMIVAIHMVWLLVGASLSRFLQNPRTSRIVNISLAVLLVVATIVAVLE
ncbi:MULTISPECIES: LysE family translocator [Rhizobium]|uniref:LysE family translocator n=1 Tax=Rhizobium tropici TaxID=398 RepID=A0A329YD11_RHITR|nr:MULTISPECIES: LysE family translocator [Rhizobium]MBB3288657.1 threonine/homoserine/homoserine lactone efflux protein [Rhizobium sp. BK252]MBB3403206.1 threonine/homoserine/homoserine lactone efflux protein [Rhizobium sp. BK289]MBB3415781.1 threonine/homoserine/homoserine lactone efflux protein [Rhizobium sp. BK284]MBB3483669.1 threonine/homoserine/homoserine lactone efflux protein [Rhizobium sp. BK347]MDK4722351.1 LysE family translocator [Rhizobium sp. CNPSo 3968]